MPRLPKPSDRARGRLVRFAAWTSAAIVLAAMAFGGDDTASPDPVVAAGPPAQTVRVDPISPGRRPPAPAVVAKALRAAGVHAVVTRGERHGALVSNPHGRAQEGTLIIEYMGEDGLSAPSTAWPPTKCMTIRADLGTEAWVTYAPSLLDLDASGACVPSNADLTAAVAAALEGAAGQRPAAPQG